MSPLSDTSPNPLNVFAQRDIAGDAVYTLSSWDNCMSVAYCKWPVIVAIIVGALIVLSVVICCARCLCCGLECCCWCCSCFNRCCPSPRGGSKGKYSQQSQQDYHYPPQQPYGYHPAMSYGPPQFATFDASTGKVKEDSLPSMPSWQTATTRHVEDPNYNAADSDDALNKEMGGTSDGIAMSSVPKEPVQYYENPETDDQHQQLLASQQQQQQQQQYAPDRSGHPYQDPNPYSPAAVGYNQQYQPNASQPYDQYNQQQNTYGGAYGQADNANSPTSVYTSNYPPTYLSRPPTSGSYRHEPLSAHPYGSPSPGPDSLPAMPQQYQQQESYQGQSYAAGGVPNFSRGQSTNYRPTSSPGGAPAEMPGSLMPGGGQRMRSPQPTHELGGSSGGSMYRRPGDGNNWQ